MYAMYNTLHCKKREHSIVIITKLNYVQSVVHKITKHKMQNYEVCYAKLKHITLNYNA